MKVISIALFLILNVFTIEQNDTPFYVEGKCYRKEKENGNGKRNSPDGRNYVGEWKDGKQHGQGTYTFTNGRVLKGLWRNDEFIGIYRRKIKCRYT